jgi:hypothetical protein
VNFSKIDEPWWDDRPVVIIGGGPSLAGFDFKRLKGRAIILAVNGSMFSVPFADAGFGLDMVGMMSWHDRFFRLTFPVWWATEDRFASFMPHKIAPNVIFVRRVKGCGVPLDGWSIASGGSSGYGALNLAVVKRARRIALLGFDYRPAKGATRTNDWHYNEAQYPKKMHQSRDRWAEWARSFKWFDGITSNGVEIVNASEHSMITAFRKIASDHVFDWLEEKVHA